MKRIQSIFYVVTMISCMLSVASCNSENEMASTNEQEPLQIVVEGVTQTRTIITGKYLPDKCKYGIFVMKSDSKEASLTNGINAQVNYVKGTSTINNNIYQSAYKCSLCSECTLHCSDFVEDVCSAPLTPISQE